MNFSQNVNYTLQRKISESIVPPVLQCLFGILGNLIAIVLLCVSSRRHRWRPFHRFVCGLAVTDLCGIVFVYPAVIVRYASGFTYDYPKELCEFISFVFSFSFMSSALIVSGMSFDRFLAIVYPHIYKHSPNTRANAILFSIWLFTAIISSLNLMGLGSVKNFYPGSWCFIDFASSDFLDRLNTYIYSVVGLIVMAVTSFLNIAVVVSICRRPRVSSDMRKGRRNEIFVISFLFSIVTLFSICWIPLMVRMLINASASNPKNGPEELLAVRMTITNAIIDPWIYIILRKENLVKMSHLQERLNNCLRLRTVYITTESIPAKDESNMMESSATNAATCSTEL
ncbi:prostaglandin E2 receptor EP4 subtype-like [Saccostrea echinata]|uniref:prostaglandin E2 receptor EP4 subtype-like n=1 Tax=Saccostrea echinata TaxID=191078 RepID=UPI002A81C0ED|nr:prostaglandin E2 receptor EP4 subtype-like [Saccostrea echinata]